MESHDLCPYCREPLVLEGKTGSPISSATQIDEQDIWLPLHPRGSDDDFDDDEEDEEESEEEHYQPSLTDQRQNLEISAHHTKVQINLLDTQIHALESRFNAPRNVVIVSDYVHDLTTRHIEDMYQLAAHVGQKHRQRDQLAIQLHSDNKEIRILDERIAAAEAQAQRVALGVNDASDYPSSFFLANEDYAQCNAQIYGLESDNHREEISIEIAISRVAALCCENIEIWKQIQQNNRTLATSQELEYIQSQMRRAEEKEEETGRLRNEMVQARERQVWIWAEIAALNVRQRHIRNHMLNDRPVASGEVL